ncbi:hypothetical protein SISSUDRAFT_1061253 [Sistotremastrum suecicum HHB10207 ss-3]|uniref:DUF6533 domain-containing protein n=1 Tax=Sistotremastrum suecicum HHB10207 ss-3 TaxID=1314776 RepID=A0A166E8P3_9AGAM|nr:hypothetical protein SISSUDRAFT_1061253 [Sistotremastrum suecicum HHB10207 ss-3]
MSNTGLTVQQEWQELLTTLDQFRAVNYSIASALAWLVYDTVCHLPSEIEYIWRAKWSFPKVLYIFARYWGIFQLGFELGVNNSVTVGVDNLYCKFWLWFYTFSGFVVFTTTVNVIFVLRIHALYNRSKRILALLIGLVLLEFGTELYVTLSQALLNDVIPRPLPFIPGCLISNGVTNRALIAWVPNFSVGFGFFVLTVIKLYQTLREQHSQSTTTGVFRLTSRQIKSSLGPMLTMFIRDGALFFALLFSISVVCAVMTIVYQHSEIVTLAYPWLVSVYAYSGSRLILNIRSVGVSKPQHSTVPGTLEFFNRSQRIHGSAPVLSLSTAASDTVFDLPVRQDSLEFWGGAASKIDLTTEKGAELDSRKSDETDAESIRMSSLGAS